MEVTLNEEQYRIYEVLKNRQPVEVDSIVEKTGLEQSKVMAFCVTAQREGLLHMQEIPREEYMLQDESFAELPERVFLRQMGSSQSLPMAEVAAKCREMGLQVSDILKWGTQRGWFSKEGKEFHIKEDAVSKHLSSGELDADEKVLHHLKSHGGRAFADEMSSQGIDLDRASKLLGRRNELVKVKSRTLRKVQIVQDFTAVLKRERTQLTPQDIESGTWRQSMEELKAYDVTLPAKVTFPAKIHPLQKILQETRRSFLQMGFTEIASPHVESAFWDFDALFQPQDHPARDMQDTFYMERPKEAKLPKASILKSVQKTHEDGGDTGSTGWGYKFKKKESKKVVLRTHTTATTIRALAADPNPPRKVYCVGRVFRNETISYKHLPEFHQVDGIVIDKDASLATLLGTLRVFYKKMGFDSVKFKPAFFPYTEPSAEVFVFMESKGVWIEMGGAGIFRPEVTEPFGCKYPVLAWGLGLERLAMLRYGIDDIRNLYWSNLSFLQEVPLCR